MSPLLRAFRLWSEQLDLVAESGADLVGVSPGAESYRLVMSGAVYGDEHVVGRHFLGVIPYRHHGIELPDGTLCENSPPGVRITSYADFARGRSTRVTNPDATAAERALAAQRALSRVGEHRYSLTGNNCEHFATWCATGIAVSQQVAEWLSRSYAAQQMRMPQ